MIELVGQQFGKYHVEAFLGTGGIADVYRANDPDLGRAVALKLLRDELSADLAFVARFLQAVPRLIALAHPQIVPVLDGGQVAGRCYLALEHQTSGSLRQRLDPQTGLPSQPPRAALMLIRQAAEGVAHAHAQDLVHGDLRPESLLLVGAGQAGETSADLLRVADFGLVGLVAGSVLVGAPAYIAPEQLQGQPPDPHSDIYALGVVLYEALTGVSPFPATSFSDAVYLHSQLPPLPPRAIRPDLPLSVEAIVLRCLAKSPADRYTSATDLLAALDVTLAELASSPVATPASRSPAQAVTATPSTPRESGPLRLTTLGPANLTLTPGVPAVLLLSLANQGTAVAHLSLSFEGAPATWISRPAGEVTVAPGGEVQLDLTINVARDPHHPAGEYPITIRVGSDEEGIATALTALWTVLPFADGELRLEPTRASGPLGASYSLHLHNLGNAPLRRLLTVTAPDHLTCLLTPATVDLDPGARALIGLKVSTPRRWFGLSQSSPLAVEAISASAVPLRAEGEFVHRATIPVWAFPLATVMLGLLVLAIVVSSRPRAAGMPVAAAPTPTELVEEAPTPVPMPVVAGPAPSAAPRATTSTTAGSTGLSLTLSASLLNFGSLPVGTNGVQNLQLLNSGTRPITFQSIQITGTSVADFVRAGPCGREPLNPGLTCPITIIFMPTGTGSRTARLTITPVGGTAQAVILTGTGTALGTAQITVPTKPPPAMAGLRGGHAAALFADGRKLLVAGGRSGLNQLKSVEVYDLVTNTWGGTRDMSVARAGHTATTLPDGTVLVLGGRSGTNTLKSAEVYDPSTQSWASFPALTTGREGHTATLLTDPRTRTYRLLVLGGRDQNGAVLTSAELYDSATRAWSETPGLIPNGRASHTATLLKQEDSAPPRILVVGGLDQAGMPAPAEIYDPTGAGSWTLVPGEPASLVASSDYTATLLEATGKVLFIGGIAGGSALKSVTVYDPTASPDQAWSEQGTLLASGRSAHTATLLPYGRILLVGGKEGPRETATTELFDPSRVVALPAIIAARTWNERTDGFFAALRMTTMDVSGLLRSWLISHS